MLRPRQSELFRKRMPRREAVPACRFTGREASVELPVRRRKSVHEAYNVCAACEVDTADPQLCTGGQRGGR